MTNNPLSRSYVSSQFGAITRSYGQINTLYSKEGLELTASVGGKFGTIIGAIIGIHYGAKEGDRLHQRITFGTLGGVLIGTLGHGTGIAIGGTWPVSLPLITASVVYSCYLQRKEELRRNKYS